MSSVARFGNIPPPTTFIIAMDQNRLVHLGWVWKKSRTTHRWNRRWLVLRDCQLSYYKSSSEHKPRKVIPRDNLRAYAHEANLQKLEFSIYTNNRVYHLRAGAAADYADWCQALDDFFHAEQFSNDEDLEGEPGPRMSHLPTEGGGEYLVEEGEIRRYRSRYNQWKKLYLIVSNRSIYVCKSVDTTQRVLRATPVADLVDIVEVDPMRGRRWCMLLITTTKSYLLSGASDTEMAKFFSAIKAVILTSRAHRKGVEGERGGREPLQVPTGQHDARKSQTIGALIGQRE